MPRQTLCNHHQGSELQPNSSRGTTTTPRRYPGMLPMGYVREEDQAVEYTWVEVEGSGSCEPYGGGDNASKDQIDCLLLDVMVMQASACKSAMADPWQTEV